MDLRFQAPLAVSYTSASQKIRILSEHWVSTQVYCPSCGHPKIDRYGANEPVADFFGKKCDEDYELKSQKGVIGGKIVNGAYGTMIERLTGSRNPNFFLLNYNLPRLEVLNLLIIPKHFFIPAVIEKRPPLPPSARRAGWVGCNIMLHGIPYAGRIYLVKNGIVEPQQEVLTKWHKTLFLRDQKDVNAKGWLLSVMQCIEKINRNIFTLDELYSFEDELKKRYPGNQFIREKIRQKLQVLRDKGYLEFMGRGVYRLVEHVD
jgi:type II restriction enzyme